MPALKTEDEDFPAAGRESESLVLKLKSIPAHLKRK